MGPRWSDQENVVAVYFISRGIPQDLMPEVLALKCPGSKRRSVHSVRNQIYELRTDYGLYDNKCRARLKRWKLNAVDEWLNKQSVTVMRSLIAYDHDVKKILANYTRRFTYTGTASNRDLDKLATGRGNAEDADFSRGALEAVNLGD